MYEQSGAAEYGLALPEFAVLLGETDVNSIEELVLARACARGNEQAWERFITIYRPKLYAAALAMTRDEAAGRELADAIYADLFGVTTRVDGSRTCKLEHFRGRGSLEGWLRAVLAQEYVNRLRRDRKWLAFDDSTGCGARTDANPAEESGNELLAACTGKALSVLSEEERFLLALYYLDGRTLADIGRMLNLHESTVSRRVEKITGALRKRIVTQLRAAGLSKQEARELLQADVRDISIDVRERLAQGRQA